MNWLMRLNMLEIYVEAQNIQEKIRAFYYGHIFNGRILPFYWCLSILLLKVRRTLIVMGFVNTTGQNNHFPTSLPHPHLRIWKKIMHVFGIHGNLKNGHQKILP